MNITEFAASRNKTVGAISNYIRRNKEQFKGLTHKEGNTMVLDDKALAILERVYPVPKPVQVISGVPEEEYRKKLEELEQARKDLIAAKDLVISLQNQITEAQLQLKDAENDKLRLEDKSKIQDIEFETEKEKRKNAEIRADGLAAEVERLKNRGLIDRVLNR